MKAKARININDTKNPKKHDYYNKIIIRKLLLLQASIPDHIIRLAPWFIRLTPVIGNTNISRPDTRLE